MSRQPAPRPSSAARIPRSCFGFDRTHHPRRYSHHQRIRRNFHALCQNRTRTDDRMVSYLATHKHDGIGSDKNEILQLRRKLVHRIVPVFAHAAFRCRMRQNLSPGADVASTPNFKPTQSIDQGERPDPAVFSDLRISGDPSQLMIGVRWKLRTHMKGQYGR